MKKFTLLVAVVMMSLGVMAQNLIENASFESWTGDQPDAWLADGGAITVSQNTETVQEGSSSCQVVFTSQDNQYLTSDSFTVQAGDPVVLSFFVYDNDLAGRARLCCIWEGADNYYGEYSEDLEEWQEIKYETVVPDGATSAEFQIRFYDVAGNWVDDAEIIVDNASFIVDNAIKPEPSNYPTDFTANANGISAGLSWVDAIGDQLPQNYLVFASSSNDIQAPVDGTVVEDDTDMSDGSAVLNISFGEEAAYFSGLAVAETYYFAIYPYTNSGENIDYKTDGNAPTAELTMPDVSIINAVDFEDNTFGGWEVVNVLGDQIWEIAPYGNPSGNCAKMSGYDGQAFDNEDWLISPVFNFDNYSNETLSFDNAMNFSGPALLLLISSDYSGDPATATWDELTFTASPGGSWDYVGSGDIDLAAYSGNVNLAYKFTSTTNGSATWEVDNILLTGVVSSAVEELEKTNFSVYPNPGTGLYQFANVNSEELHIKVYSVLGQLVNEFVSANELIELDITNEKEGMYLVQIEGKSSKQTVSVIKK